MQTATSFSQLSEALDLLSERLSYNYCVMHFVSFANAKEMGASRTTSIHCNLKIPFHRTWLAPTRRSCSLHTCTTTLPKLEPVVAWALPSATGIQQYVRYRSAIPTTAKRRIQAHCVNTTHWNLLWVVCGSQKQTIISTSLHYTGHAYCCLLSFAMQIRKVWQKVLPQSLWNTHWGT